MEKAIKYNKEWIESIGRRKSSVARIFMEKGKGKFLINEKPHNEYIRVKHLVEAIELPLKALDLSKAYDIKINVHGGGIKGQAEAVMLGLARALVKINPDYKEKMKELQLMTRDPRKVERKKPGLRKARKKEQYSKR
jgi:small subunit ribosomal protein S9